MAEELISEFRKNKGYEERLYTIFNRGFTRYEVSDISSLYNSDRIHLNGNGTAKLCFYLIESLRRSKILPAYATTTYNGRQTQPTQYNRFANG